MKRKLREQPDRETGKKAKPSERSEDADPEFPVVFPGQIVTSYMSTSSEGRILGRGLSYDEKTRDVAATLWGRLVRVDDDSNRWFVLPFNRTVYVPSKGDFVIGIITEKIGTEAYVVDLNTYRTCKLPTTNFDGATRRHRPQLKVHDYVYCYVADVSPAREVELSCAVSDELMAVGIPRKDWSSKDAVFGKLDRVDGTTLNGIDYASCVDLVSNSNSSLNDSLHALGLGFELVAGINNRVYVGAESTEDVVAVVGALKTIVSSVR